MRCLLFLFLVVPMIVVGKPPAVDITPYLKQIAAEQATPLPDCYGLSEKSRTLCETIRAAQKIASECELSVYETKTGLTREFCIVIQDPDTKKLKPIMLEMAVNPQKGFQPKVKTEHDPPYTVLRTHGTSFIKMRFAVYEAHDDGRKLYAYAAKHLNVPTGTDLRSAQSVREHAVPQVHLAADTHLLDRELAKRGLQFGWKAVQDIPPKMQFIASKIRSDRAVSEVVPTHFLLGILVAEQTDQDMFFGGKGWETYHLDMDDVLGNEAVQMVGLDLFMNGIIAYRHIRSGAGACGTWQFMPGTYEVVRAKYPHAGLDPDYRRGCQSFGNLGGSALLLSDSEIAASGKIVHDHYNRDPELAMLYVAAKYNAGKERGEYLAQFVDRYERKWGVIVTVKTFPWSEFRETTRKDGPKRFPRETLGYVRKVAHLLNLTRHLVELR